MPRQTPQDEINDVRRQMALIRHDMHQDVSGVIQNAERVLDWKRFIQNAPWVSISLAGVAGYLLIPRKRQPRQVEITGLSPEDRRALADEIRQLSHNGGGVPATPVNGLMNGRATSGEKVKKKAGPVQLVSWAARMALPIALNYAQSYASVWFDDFLRQQSGARTGTSDPTSRPSQHARGF